MKMQTYFLPLLFAALFCGSNLSGQNAENPTSQDGCFNSEAINWVIPGKFDEARLAAQEQNRILLVRALGFGLDELGASCATKGCW